MTIRSAYDAGRDEFAVTGFLPYFRRVEYTVNDLTAGVLAVPVQAGAYVLGVGLLIKAAFAGGVPVVEVGDGSDVDGFIDSTAPDVNPTSANAAYFSLGGANALAQGKYYPTAGTVTVTHNAEVTEGEATLLICELQFADNWRSLGNIGQNG